MFLEKRFECIEFGFPELSVLFYPGGYLLKLVQVGLTISFAPFLAYMNEPAFGKDLYVFGNSWSADREMVCHGVKVQRLAGQQANDGAAGRVCYCLENISTHIEYICNRSVTNISQNSEFKSQKVSSRLRWALTPLREALIRLRLIDN